MVDVKLVREFPDEVYLQPDWLLDDIITSMQNAGLLPHYGQGGDLVTAADASDLATLKTLTKDISDAQVLHGLDTGIHSAADAAMDEPAEFSSSPAEPADLAECQAILNEIKDNLTTHIANATPHRDVGGQGGVTPAGVTTTDGSNQATNETLANAIKAAFNKHAQMGYADFSIT